MDCWIEYADDIRKGRIPASQYIKQAVERYYTDLANPLYTFDTDKVRRIIKFGQMCRHTKGHLRGKRIKLEPWQQFIIANLFGFIRVSDGQRKYRFCYIEVARKNGKTTIAAVIALWFLLGEKGQNDIFCAAPSLDQSKICFDAAKQMSKMSFEKYIKSYQHHLLAPADDSIMKALASRSHTIEGTNPSLAIVDELHLHPDNSIYSALALGIGARLNGMILTITTSGNNHLSVCREQHDYLRQVLNGEVDDPSLFGMIYCLDSEKEVDDESQWIKANPNLGISVLVDELRSQVKRARGLPSSWNELLCKRFDLWQKSESTWIKHELWKACHADISLDDLLGQECYIGLDLSSKSDLTAISLIFPQGDKLLVFGKYYLPEDCLKDDDNKNAAFYRSWVRQGYLQTTQGNVIDYDFIKRDILEFSELFNVVSVSYDSWNATHLTTMLASEGIVTEKVRQGFASLSPPIKEIEVYIKTQQLQHDGNPVLAWAVDNVVLQVDPAGNCKTDKSRSANKIDPVVSLVTALATYILDKQEMQIKNGVIMV